MSYDSKRLVQESHSPSPNQCENVDIEQVSLRKSLFALGLFLQLALVLFELGTDLVSSIVASAVVVIQILTGVAVWRSIGRQILPSGGDVAMGIGLGALFFCFISVFVNPPTAVLTMLSVLLVVSLRNRRAISEALDLIGPASFGKSLEVFFLIAAVQFLFLAPMNTRFLLAGLTCLGTYVAFRRIDSSEDAGLALIQKIALGAGPLVIVVTHLVLMSQRQPFEILDPSVIFSQDAVTQAAMSRSLVEHGPFDSVLMVGVQDRYHWLSWAWAGGLGNLIGGQYWLSTEVVLPGSVGFMFAASLVSLHNVSRRSGTVLMVAVSAILLMDSSLENAPTVDFGGTSGYFGLLGLILIVPLVEMLKADRVTPAIAGTFVAVSFGLLAKVSFGLVIVGTSGLSAVFVALVMRRYRTAMCASGLACVLLITYYVTFLRPFSQTENPSFSVKPSIAVLGYEPLELIDLIIRIIPFVALLLLQFLGKVRLQVGVVIGVGVTCSLLLLLDIRNSGPISFIWTLGLLVGLSIFTSENLQVPVRIVVLAAPIALLGFFVSFGVVSLQWLGQAQHRSEILLLLWAGFVGVLVFALALLIVGTGTWSERAARSLTGLLVASVLYCAGSFFAQIMRVEVREFTDRREGIVREPILFGEAATQRREVAETSSWIRENTEQSEVFAADERYLGSMIAALTGRRAFVASDHSYFSHPEEYVRRQDLVSSYLTTESSGIRMTLVCEGVSILVRSVANDSDAEILDFPEFQSGSFSVIRLDASGELAARCD